jgi:hypothetical protein
MCLKGECIETQKVMAQQAHLINDLNAKIKELELMVLSKDG